MAEAGGSDATLEITVVACIAARTTREWILNLPHGATVADALAACGDPSVRAAKDDGGALGVWGRAAGLDTRLQHRDRVEIYRPLQVDPKVARRERFARQGARTTGLFARQRPGGKAGY
jgi:putative ubiquitin-RnfH superfamily antitoxin RatB of RatAB toxin-antitoxin module